jgi:hypothetical protein
MFRSYDHLQEEICVIKYIYNKIVNNYWNSVALDGNPWTWSSTRNRMQTTKFKIINASQAYSIPLCCWLFMIMMMMIIIIIIIVITTMTMITTTTIQKLHREEVVRWSRKFQVCLFDSVTIIPRTSRYGMHSSFLTTRFGWVCHRKILHFYCIYLKAVMTFHTHDTKLKHNILGPSFVLNLYVVKWAT